jgi:hypothetical protein
MGMRPVIVQFASRHTQIARRRQRICGPEAFARLGNDRGGLQYRWLAGVQVPESGNANFHPSAGMTNATFEDS